MHASSNWSDRGGKWVAAQAALMLLVFVCAFLPPGWGDAAVFLAALGAPVAFVGLLVVVWSWRTLDRAATPFPRPNAGGRLIQSGPYAFVRHPIYVGAILLFGGFALATSPAAFVPFALLALLFRNKAALEEDWLEETYPEYADYRRRVTGAFVPRSLPTEGLADEL